MATDTKQMTYALQDIEKYATQLQEGAALLEVVGQAYLDVPGADEEVRTAESFAKAYRQIASDILRYTARGLEE